MPEIINNQTFNEAKKVWCLRLWLVLSIDEQETGVFNTINQEHIE